MDESWLARARAMRGRPFYRGDRVVRSEETTDGAPSVGTVVAHESEGFVDVLWDGDEWVHHLNAMAVRWHRPVVSETKLIDGLLDVDAEIGTLLCPLCTEPFTYVHPTRVTVNAGGALTTVDALGTRMDVGRAAGRGVLITLAFTCEGGHLFEQQLHFHKGATFVAVHRRTGDAEAEDTIWRD